jgi:hypothetical protein
MRNPAHRGEVATALNVRLKSPLSRLEEHCFKPYMNVGDSKTRRAAIGKNPMLQSACDRLRRREKLLALRGQRVTQHAAIEQSYDPDSVSMCRPCSRTPTR